MSGLCLLTIIEHARTYTHQMSEKARAFAESDEEEEGKEGEQKLSKSKLRKASRLSVARTCCILC